MLTREVRLDLLMTHFKKLMACFKKSSINAVDLRYACSL